MTTSNPLHPSVRAAFFSFSVRFEGAIDHLYPDKDGGITTSVGYLCDSPAAARRLPLHWADGRAATGDEIEAEWHAVKANEAAAANGAAWLKRTGGVKLFLSADDVRRLCTERFDQVAVHLAREFPAMTDWPASAQLAVASMAWALGVDGLLKKFPKCCAAMRRGDFTTTAAECRIDDTTNAGVTARNVANRSLFLAAQHQVDTGADPSVLLMAPPPGLTAAQHAAAVATLGASLRTSTGDLIEDDMAKHRRRT